MFLWTSENMCSSDSGYFRFYYFVARMLLAAVVSFFRYNSSQFVVFFIFLNVEK